jgi:hypothetical protein
LRLTPEQHRISPLRGRPAAERPSGRPVLAARQIKIAALEAQNFIIILKVSEPAVYS